MYARNRFDITSRDGNSKRSGETIAIDAATWQTRLKVHLKDTYFYNIIIIQGKGRREKECANKRPFAVMITDDRAYKLLLIELEFQYGGS